MISAGARVDVVTRNGNYTPLHLAAKSGNAPVVRALLDASADASAKTSSGGALPLHLAAAQGNSIWMRVVMLAPSASNAMSTTVLGDTEMTQMRRYFVKPQAAIPMTVSEDPLMGMTCDRFTGSATAQLPTQSFVVRTAALR